MIPKVGISKGERCGDTVRRAVDLSGGVGHLTEKPVLIKVNFIATKTWETGATTDPLVVETLIEMIGEVNPDIAVIESDANMTDADKAAEVTGMLEVCERHDVPFKNLKREKERVKLECPTNNTFESVSIPRIVAESHIVDAAKLKTHKTTLVTLGMKNLFGLMPNKWKFRYHMRGIENVILDINSAISPSLVVIDGLVAMEGEGPADGTPVDMGLVLAGRDVVATDIVGSRAMGFDPRKIKHISMAVEAGLGGWDYEIAGDSLEEVKRDFRAP